MKTSYVQKVREDGSTYLVDKRHLNEYTPDVHFVQPDLPEYDSPIDGSIVRGRRQRRNDLAKNNCRPFEAGEREAARQRVADRDRAIESKIVERLRWINA
jgi:hypothetical protein